MFDAVWPILCPAGEQGGEQLVNAGPIGRLGVRVPGGGTRRRHQFRLAASSACRERPLPRLREAGLWLWLAWANGRGYHWARPAFAVFFGLLTIVVFFGLGQGGGEDALPYTLPDVIATAVLWLAGLAAGVLILSDAAGPHYQQEPAQR